MNDAACDLPTGVRAAELAGWLDRGPARVGLLQEPTPLHRAPRLSDRLGVEILFKRDDLTGLAFGGNKLRVLDYLLADALRQGCDSIVTGAGPQSNWTLLAALAALRCGLEPHIISYGNTQPPTGNLLLHGRIGVSVSFTGDPDKFSVDAEIDRTAVRLRADGRRPYVIPRGGATPLGSIGYVRASLEITRQLVDLDVLAAEIWLATGSCGTHAGLAAGHALLAGAHNVVGVTVSRPAVECVQRISRLAAGAAHLLGASEIDPSVVIREGWIGPGYGMASAAGNAAIDLVATTEGIFLDPIFGAKAMAALIAESLAHRVNGPVVFLVTGGGPTLFAAPEPTEMSQPG